MKGKKKLPPDKPVPAMGPGRDEGAVNGVPGLKERTPFQMDDSTPPPAVVLLAATASAASGSKRKKVTTPKAVPSKKKVKWRSSTDDNPMSSDADPSSSMPQAPECKRPDVAARIAANKSLDFFTVKKTLRAFSTLDAQQLAWTECIKEVNQAVAEGYLLAYYYVLLQVTAGGPLSRLDSVFYRTCLTMVTNTEYQSKNGDLNSAAAEFNRIRGGRPLANTQYLNQGWFMAAATQMATNAQNMFIKNFAKRLRQYVIDCYEMTCDEVNKVVQRVFDPEYEASIDGDDGSDQRADVHEDGQRNWNGQQHEEDESYDITNDEVLDTIAISLRLKIPRKDNGKISWKPHDLVPIYYEFLEYVEQWNSDHENDADFKKTKKRVFPLLPTKRGYVCEHRKIDSTGLYALLRRSPAISRDLTVEHEGATWTLGQSLQSATVWRKMADLWWRKIFRVDEVERVCGGHFHGEITTDGYSVSIMMDRPKRNNKGPTQNLGEGTLTQTTGKKRKRSELPRKVRRSKAASRMTPAQEKPISDALGFPLPTIPKGITSDYDVVWGIDPGRTDFIMAVNQDNQTLRFRTSCFHRASGYNRSNRKSRHRIDKKPGLRELLRSTPTKKTASRETLEVAIDFWFSHGPDLLKEFMDEKFYFRKLRFRRYSLRTAQLERACYEIAGAPGTKTVVGFGDSGTRGQGIIKRCVAGPVKEFARRFSRHCEVVVIDEYRTSKVHYDCECIEDLVNQRVKRVCRDGIERNVPVHKVLHCLKKRGERGGCGVTVDRDINAAKNIRGILQAKLDRLPRPVRLRRFN